MVLWSGTVASGQAREIYKWKEVWSVANHILNNALHVYFLSNESNTLAQLTEAECLYGFLLIFFHSSL